MPRYPANSYDPSPSPWWLKLLVCLLVGLVAGGVKWWVTGEL